MGHAFGVIEIVIGPEGTDLGAIGFELLDQILVATAQQIFKTSNRGIKLSARV